MKTILKISATSGMLALLAGCASFSDISAVESAKTIDSSGASAFNKALSADYADYAIYESENEGEWGHGASFARKAMRAANNEAVDPEDVVKWTIPDDRAAVLNEHRAAMLSKFAAGGKGTHPAFAGRAQGQFDCWVEEEAEGVTDSNCMKNHMAAIAKISGSAQVANMPGSFIVYFGHNSAEMVANSDIALDMAVNAGRNAQMARAALIGHTDTSGNSAYNIALSQRRVKAVAAALKARGLATSETSASVAGESKPQVMTGDGVREGKNRRVEIFFER
jgi:outer membrane protein OmpA-like peptidoglycan-associated protein